MLDGMRAWELVAGHMNTPDGVIAVIVESEPFVDLPESRPAGLSIEAQVLGTAFSGDLSGASK
jgi:hypothetical protein